MRETKSDRGGLDGAVDRSMDSDGHNLSGVESRLGRKYEGKGPRGKSTGRGKGAKRAKSSARKSR